LNINYRPKKIRGVITLALILNEKLYYALYKTKHKINTVNSEKKCWLKVQKNIYLIYIFLILFINRNYVKY